VFDIPASSLRSLQRTRPFVAVASANGLQYTEKNASWIQGKYSRPLVIFSCFWLLALISDGGKLPICIICAEDDLSKQTINEPTPNNLQGYFEGPYFQPANEGADVISFRKAVTSCAACRVSFCAEHRLWHLCPFWPLEHV
jgi:hypothetical protein